MANYQIDRNKFFDPDERKRLLEYTEAMSIRDEKKGRLAWPARWMLVRLAMQTGLRVSEIADLKLRRIRLAVADPYIIVRHGKGGKKRDVYIDRQLKEHLEQYIELYRSDTDQDDYLFRGRNGQPITTNALYLSFKKAVIEAGLRNDLSIHSSRHTYATLLLHKTGNMRYVQKQLGHSQINMTALYADILPEENGKLANKILE